MDIFSHDNLAELTDVRSEHTVSIFLPTHRVGPDSRPFASEDVIRWKNLVRQAADRLAGEGASTFRVPLHFDELVVVASRFHLKPLLPMLVGDSRFYVLALSQNEVRLIEAALASGAVSAGWWS